MIFEYADYRSFLKATMARRIARNPRYSLRSFAKALGVSPAMLSQIHSGKRGLSVESAAKMTKALKLRDDEADYFLTLVQLDSCDSNEMKLRLQERLRLLHPAREVFHLPTETFHVISEWYYFPILQLLHLPGFTFTPRQIARRLGISEQEASSALERLLHIGVLTVKGGRYIRVQKQLRVASASREEALRNFHKQMLLKAIESLESQTPDEKYVGSETFAFDPDQLHVAKKMIDKFLDQMNELTSKSKKPTEVYHFNASFFRLTRKARP